MTYSASELSEKLQTEGYDISQRNINYYAFEKKMFEINTTGKKCFTESEADKLKSIALLKECTSYTLTQIKEIISKRTLEEVKSLCANKVINTVRYTKTYGPSTANYINYKPESLTTQASCCMDSNSSLTRIITPYLLTPITPLSPEPASNTDRILKVNDQVTLLLGNQIESDKVRKIVEFIKGLE